MLLLLKFDSGWVQYMLFHSSLCAHTRIERLCLSNSLLMKLI